MTNYKAMPVRDRYTALNGSMVLPINFSYQASCRLVDDVHLEVPTPLVYGWFYDVLRTLAVHAAGVRLWTTPVGFGRRGPTRLRESRR